MYYNQDKYAEASRWFESTIKIDPSRAIAYLNLGDAMAKKGDAAKAKNAYKVFIEIAPTSKSVTYAKQQIEKL